MARYAKIVRLALPPIPPINAICHKNICSQAECGHCSRLIAAHHALDQLDDLETLWPPDYARETVSKERYATWKICESAWRSTT